MSAPPWGSSNNMSGYHPMNGTNEFQAGVDTASKYKLKKKRRNFEGFKLSHSVYNRWSKGKKTIV